MNITTAVAQTLRSLRSAFQYWCIVLTVFFATTPAFADNDDLFEAGKKTVVGTVGDGSSGEFYILAAGLIGGVIVGIVQKNWIGGIIGFFVGVVFWEIGKGLVGL